MPARLPTAPLRRQTQSDAFIALKRCSFSHKMKKLSLLVAFLGLASFSACPHVAFAQSVASDPVGFTTSSLLGSSDTYVSFPFTRPFAFIGMISSISGNAITVGGTPGWTSNQFVYAAGTQSNHYYVLLGGGGSSNPKEGHIYPVNANGLNTLTIDATSDDLTGVTANTQLTLIPYWTPATIFPATDASVSFTPTTSPPSYQTLIRVPDYSAAGINLPYAAEYYFNNNAWRRVSDGLDHGDDALVPDGYFVIRNSNGAPTLPLTNIGAVVLKKISPPLETSTGSAQDNPAGIVRPLDVALDATGLGPANGSFVANDQLLVFNNSQAALDKSPAIYYYDTSVGNSGGWRLTGDSVATNDHGADIIPMGAGFIVRKAQTGTGQPAFWTNAFPVQALTAVSRKIHGSAGTFDFTLPLNVQFYTLPGIESRVAGQTPAGAGIDHQIVLTFPTAVAFTNIIPTSGAASVDSFSGNNSTTVTINLKSVSNAQKTTITLLGVNNGSNTNDVAVQMGVLIGDTNGDRFVNSADISQTKSQSGQAVTVSNFRRDVNADGFLNSGDISLVKSRSGTALP
jgi:uncharacterized protein (TIGR02597 family)